METSRAVTGQREVTFLVRPGVPQAESDQPRKGAGPAELVLVALLLAGVMAIQLSAGGSWGLFARHFWLDEFFTHAMVADRSLSHAVEAMASGAEKNPPTLIVLLYGYTRLVGSTDEVALRSFMFLSILAALVGLHGCLRLSFPRLACITALLAAWSHPLLINHAFNARFYGPWLAAVVWYALLLIRMRGTRFPLATGIALAICAVLVCTLQYLGVVALVLVTAGELLARRRARQEWRPGLWAAAAGPIALACCVPLYLRQSVGMAAITWMAPINFSFAWDLLRAFVDDFPFAWLAMAAALCAVARHDRGPATRGDGILGGLTALLTMPLVMMAGSRLIQPMYDTRYSLPAVAGLAVAAAWLAACCRRGWLVLLCGGLIVLGAVRLQTYDRQMKGSREDADGQLVAKLRSMTGRDPIVFESPIQLLPVYCYAPDLRARCAGLDYELGEVGNRLSAEVFTRDFFRRYARYYPEPPLVPWSQVRQWPRFFLVPGDYGRRLKPTVMDEFYPGFHARVVAPDLYELTAKQGP